MRGTYPVTYNPPFHLLPSLNEGDRDRTLAPRCKLTGSSVRTLPFLPPVSRKGILLMQEPVQRPMRVPGTSEKPLPYELLEEWVGAGRCTWGGALLGFLTEENAPRPIPPSSWLARGRGTILLQQEPFQSPRKLLWRAKGPHWCHQISRAVLQPWENYHLPHHTAPSGAEVLRWIWVTYRRFVRLENNAWRSSAVPKPNFWLLGFKCCPHHPAKEAMPALVHLTGFWFIVLNPDMRISDSASVERQELPRKKGMLLRSAFNLPKPLSIEAIESFLGSFC